MTTGVSKKLNNSYLFGFSFWGFSFVWFCQDSQGALKGLAS